MNKVYTVAAVAVLFLFANASFAQAPHHKVHHRHHHHRHHIKH